MSTRKLLLGTALALCLLLPQPSQADLIDLGSNPDVKDRPSLFKGGPFQDQYTFSLSGFPEFFAEGMVTSSSSNQSTFIAGLSAAIYRVVGSIDADGAVNPDDVLLFGPALATELANVSCPSGQATCQIINASGIIAAGTNYYLEISGDAGPNAVYTLDFAAVGVPGPVAGAGLPGLVMALGGILGWRRLRKVA